MFWFAELLCFFCLFLLWNIYAVMCSCRGNFLLPCIIFLNGIFAGFAWSSCISWFVFVWKYIDLLVSLKAALLAVTLLVHCFVSKLKIHCSTLFCFLEFPWKAWGFPDTYVFVYELVFFFCTTFSTVYLTSWLLYVMEKFSGKVCLKFKCFLCLDAYFCLQIWEFVCFNFPEKFLYSFWLYLSSFLYTMDQVWPP